MKKITKSIATMLAALSVAACISSCGNGSSGTVERAEAKTQKQAVQYYDDSSGGVSPSKPAETKAAESICSCKINIEYEKNFMFAKYNVDLIIDGEKADTIANGKTVCYTFNQKKGKYVIRAEKNGDSSVFGEATFNIFENGQTINVSLKTHEDYIEVTVDD